MEACCDRRPRPQTVESNPPEPGRPASPPAGFHQADEHRPRRACRQAFLALRLTQRCCQSAAAACWRAGTHAPTAARRDWHRRVGGNTGSETFVHEVGTAVNASAVLSYFVPTRATAVTSVTARPLPAGRPARPPAKPAGSPSLRTKATSTAP